MMPRTFYSLWTSGQGQANNSDWSVLHGTDMQVVYKHNHLTSCMQTLAAHEALENRHAEVQQQHTAATGQATSLQQDLASANARSASHMAAT